MTRTRGQPRLVDGEETVARTFKLPVGLDRRLRAHAIRAAMATSAIVRAAISEYLSARSG